MRGIAIILVRVAHCIIKIENSENARVRPGTKGFFRRWCVKTNKYHLSHYLDDNLQQKSIQDQVAATAAEVVFELRLID